MGRSIIDARSDHCRKQSDWTRPSLLVNSTELIEMPEQLGRPRLFDCRTFPIVGSRPDLFVRRGQGLPPRRDESRPGARSSSTMAHFIGSPSSRSSRPRHPFLARAFDVTNKTTNNKGGTGAALPRFFTIGDVANFLEVSSRTVRRWIKTGALRIHRFGSAVRISEADVLAFIATHREG